MKICTFLSALQTSYLNVQTKLMFNKQITEPVYILYTVSIAKPNKYGTLRNSKHLFCDAGVGTERTVTEKNKGKTTILMRIIERI